MNYNKTKKSIKKIRNKSGRKTSNVRNESMKSKKSKKSINSKKSCNKNSKNLIKKAIALIFPNKYGIKGEVIFTQQSNINQCKVEYNITGLSDGKHGFHIHESGDLTNGCDSACAHFNPYNKKHGSINSKERHAGDLGNIVSKNKVSKGNLIAKDISLNSKKTNILGRTIIIHQDEDDLGRGKLDKKEESLKTGNAGKRLACGIIGIM